MFPTFRYGPLCSNLNFVGVHLNLISLKNEPQKGYGGDMELTLLSLYEQLILHESVQHCPDMISVLLRTL